MKCIILAAGYSTRLYPLTLDNPKSLLQVAGKPMIEHILDRLKNIDEIEEIIIVSNNKFFNNFRNWKRQFSFNRPIKLLNDGTNSNEERLGAVGDINFAISEENISSEVFVVAGDNLFKFNLRGMFDLYAEKKATVIALHDIKEKSAAAGKYGIVVLGGNSRITDLEEKPANPKTSLVSTACYIFSADAIGRLKSRLKEHKVDNIGDFIGWLAKNNEVYGHVYGEDWVDIGTPDQLKEANLNWPF